MAADVIVRIRTALERGGVDAAREELRRLEEEARRAGESGDGLARIYAGIGRKIAVGLSAGTAALAAFVKQGIDVADELNVISKRTGVSVENLSRLKFAAEQTETNFEALTRGLQRLNINIGKTGVQGAELLPVFLAIAGRIKEAGSAAEQAAIANQVFGRGIGAQLLPFMKEGEAGLRKLIGAEADFAEISTQTARTADEFNDSIARLKTQATQLAVEIGGPLINALNKFLEFRAKIAKEGEISTINRELDDLRDKLRETAGAGAPPDILAGLISPEKAERIGKGLGEVTRRIQELTKARTALQLGKPEQAGTAASGGGVDQQAQAAADEIVKVQKKKTDAEKEADKAAKKAAKERAKALKEEASEVKKAADEAAKEAERRQESIDNVNNSLREQIESTNAERDALVAGGAEGQRYATIQSEIAKIVKETGTVTAGQIEEVKRLAAAQQGVRDTRFAQSLQDQVDALNLQSQAFSQGAAEATRYAVIQREISRAQAEGVEITASLIEKIRGLADAQANVELQEESRRQIEQANEEAIRQFEQQSAQITESLTDALLRGFENGKSLAENFKDTLVNLFKTLVLRPVIEFIVKPVAQFAQQAITGVLGSIFGIPGAGGAGGGGGGFNIESIGDLFSSGGQALGLAQQIGTLSGGIGGTSTIPGFVGQIIPSLETSASSLSSISAQLSSSGLSNIPGLLSSVITGIQTPALAKFATLAAQEIGTAVAGQSFGASAAGFVGRFLGPGLTNAGFGAIGAILAKLVGIGKNSDPTANAILTGVGGVAGAGIGTAIASGTAYGSYGGPIGAIIGAILGAALSSAIPATPPRGFESVDFSSGKGRIRKAGKKGFDAGTLDSTVNEIIDSLFAVNKELKLGLDRTKIKFFLGFKAGKGFQANIGGKDVNFEDIRKAQGAIFKEELFSALPDKERTKFQKAVLQRAFAKQNDTLAEQLGSIQKDLGVRKRLQDFTKVVEFDPAKEKINELRGELRKLTTDFNALKGEAKELGLNTNRAEEAFRKTKRRKLDEILGIKIERQSTRVEAQQQAFQLAGEDIPFEIQAKGVELQFKALGIQFRALGLDTKVLDKLLGKALENLKEAQDQAGSSVNKLRDQLNAQAQAFQLAGRQLPLDIQRQLTTLQFDELGDQFRDLGLDTKILSELLAEALANLDQAQESARVNVQTQAFQAAGRQVPIELQQAAIVLQFAELGDAFRDLGLDTSNLSVLLREALDNIQQGLASTQLDAVIQAYQAAGRQVPLELQQYALVLQFAELADRFRELGLDTANLSILLQDAIQNIGEALASTRLDTDIQSYQAAGRRIPLALQKYALELQFAELGDAFRDLGLNTGNLSILLADGLRRLERAEAQAKVSVRSQAFQLAGREVPIELQKAGVRLQFEELAEQFRDLGLSTTDLSRLLAQAIANLDIARQEASNAAIQQAYQLAGRQVPIAIQKSAIILQFDRLRTQFQDLGLDAGILTGLLSDALANIERDLARAKQGALERAFQLAGEEVPKDIQIAGITAEFAELGKLFSELGLDSGILGGLLQKAIEKINKAGEDLKTGGFIGFIDEFGRITELDPRFRDIGSTAGTAANDPIFTKIVGGRTKPPGSIIDPGMTTNVPGFATGTQNRIVTSPQLFLAGERGPESVTVRPLVGSARGSSTGDVNINLNGTTIFDDITQTKFARTVARQLESRRFRFG